MPERTIYDIYFSKLIAFNYWPEIRCRRWSIQKVQFSINLSSIATCISRTTQLMVAFKYWLEDFWLYITPENKLQRCDITRVRRPVEQFCWNQMLPKSCVSILGREKFAIMIAVDGFVPSGSSTALSATDTIFSLIRAGRDLFGRVSSINVHWDSYLWMVLAIVVLDGWWWTTYRTGSFKGSQLEMCTFSLVARIR